MFLTAIEHTGSSPVGAIKWRLQQSFKTENSIDNIFPFETASCKKKEVAYEPKRRFEDVKKQFDVYKAKMESLLISQEELIKEINQDEEE